MSIFTGYWQRKYLECERERRRLEADAKCHRGLYDNAEEDLSKLHDKLFLQSVAIDRLEKEVNALTEERDKLQAEAVARDREIGLLNDLIRVLRTNSRLWESAKGAVLGEEAEA